MLLEHSLGLNRYPVEPQCYQVCAQSREKHECTELVAPGAIKKDTRREEYCPAVLLEGKYKIHQRGRQHKEYKV